MYWLIREAKLSHKATYDLVNNQTKGIQFDTLSKICKALDCTPNDVLYMND
ncbi:helix-turn-helix domain-containing protein [Brevibacillus sp. 179-C9.3 HS]|uniref:helix-turn-helix domain-containing protein n=1 Tax=unclassified Brevibacillus TaxID=2684853 RepID=UPI0039A093FB